jgi:hypothetical protein
MSLCTSIPVTRSPAQLQSMPVDALSASRKASWSASRSVRRLVQAAQIDAQVD